MLESSDPQEHDWFPVTDRFARRAGWDRAAHGWLCCARCNVRTKARAGGREPADGNLRPCNPARRTP